MDSSVLVRTYHQRVRDLFGDGFKYVVGRGIAVKPEELELPEDVLKMMIRSRFKTLALAFSKKLWLENHLLETGHDSTCDCPIEHFGRIE